MKPIKIVYPSSDWASNLGNPFFNLGMEYVLKTSAIRAKKDIDLLFTASNPEKSFKTKGKYKNNTFNYAKYYQGADILVLAGPLFDLSFGTLFEEILANAKKNNTKVFIVSAGGITYSKEEVEHCRMILKKYPPYALTTRDSDTYNNYHDLAENSLDAICGAWFVPDYYSGYDTEDIGKYVTMTFDHTLEPKLGLTEFDGNKETLKNISLSPSSHSFSKKIIRLTQRRLPLEINGYKVIRPNHCTLNRPNWRLFFKPNSFITQTPYGLLNIYRNTSLTVTDRLHASVATLAYGNPAKLIIKSKRIKLLERIPGATEIFDKPSTIDIDWLNKEKQMVVDWFTKVFREL